MTRVPIGERIRDQRRRRGLTQGALARRVNISPGYLSLIENNKRQIGGSLLHRVAAALGVDSDRLTAYRDDRLAADLAELTRALDLPRFDEASAAAFVGHSPAWAYAFVAVCRRLQDTTDKALALAERLRRDPELTDLSHVILTKITSIRSFAEILSQYDNVDAADQKRFAAIVAAESDRLTQSARALLACLETDTGALRSASPEREVDDFLIDHRNYFAPLESAASELRRRIGETPCGPEHHALVTRLERVHGARIRRGAVGDGSLAANVIALPAAGHLASERFALARALAERELDPVIHELVRDERLTTDASREKARGALARYGAASLLFPYEAFLEAAERYRHDMDLLGELFCASFEQVAHRLVTLRRNGAEGIPFAFMRTDPAGNISKRFSLPDFRMPQYGSACALWIVYGAFAMPGRVLSQMLETPGGDRFLLIARNVSKSPTAHARPRAQFSVMIGCDAGYSDRIVYGDAYAGGHASLVTRGGFACRACPRTDCCQRAFEPVVGVEGREAPPGEPAPMAVLAS